jgi:hypothetical protein
VSLQLLLLEPESGPHVLDSEPTKTAFDLNNLGRPLIAQQDGDDILLRRVLS